MNQDKSAPIFQLTALIAAALAGIQRPLAIVFFHVDQDPGHPFFALQGGFSDYHAIIPHAVHGAFAQHPEAAIVMLTDERTAFAPLPMTVIRLPLIREWIMRERSRCQEAFARAWNGPAIHLDTDIVLQRRFDDVFQVPFDIGVTYRGDHPGMPINGGMLLCRNPLPFASFMGDCADLHDAIALSANRNARHLQGWSSFDLRCFRGGQMALACMLSGVQPGQVYELSWGKVGVFHADQINRTFEAGQTDGAYALHYKGPRKRALTAPTEGLAAAPFVTLAPGFHVPTISSEKVAAHAAAARAASEESVPESAEGLGFAAESAA